MTQHSVLIIEDDPAMSRALRDNFAAQGYTVSSARNGEEGLQLAVSKAPDLVLLDIMLPKINGFELCRLLRSRQLQMPIIMLTAKGQEEDIIRGLELGADDYVTKPFSIRQLLARAKSFLRRRVMEQETSFSFGECALDLSAHKLLRNNVPVPLTRKEFRLLEYLVQHRGRALTRNQILDAVWGFDILVNDRSVDRCITTLRAKIETDHHHPMFIQTVRDIGYRFELGREG